MNIDTYHKIHIERPEIYIKPQKKIKLFLTVFSSLKKMYADRYSTKKKKKLITAGTTKGWHIDLLLWLEYKNSPFKYYILDDWMGMSDWLDINETIGQFWNGSKSINLELNSKNNPSRLQKMLSQIIDLLIFKYFVFLTYHLSHQTKQSICFNRVTACKTI